MTHVVFYFILLFMFQTQEIILSDPVNIHNGKINLYMITIL